MKCLNKTHYYNEFTKIYNFVPDSTSFSYESSRRDSYFQRLYFEYKYCQSVGGIAFFYTLTYNDSSIPKYLGHPCFSYNDIRYVVNGRLSKVLLRKYGSRLRYFCSCERGEGKGVRGVGNNPHYHFVFFVLPANDDKYRFVRIQPIEFLGLIQEIWQGKKGYIPYNSAKFGIAQPGLNLGEVTSSDCFSYCCKYVVKDVAEKDVLDSINKYWFRKCLDEGYSSLCVYNYYCWLKDNGRIKDKYEFFDIFKIGRFHYHIKTGLTGSYPFVKWVSDYCGADAQVFLSDFFDWYQNIWVNSYVSFKLADYKNNYSSKPRSSKSLGLYGLEFIKNKDSKPFIEIPSSSGYKVQSPCLYYIRHLYYDTFVCPVTGNNLYRLNDFGKQVKLNRLSVDVSSFEKQVRSNIDICLNNPDISFSPFDNDDNDFLARSYLKSLVDSSDFDELLRRYSFFHCVYQFRSFNKLIDVSLIDTCSFDDVYKDYKKFLSYDLINLDFDNCILSNVLYIGSCSTQKQFISFINHPAFINYAKAFNFLDCLYDSVSSFLSEQKKDKFLSKQNVQKRLNSFRFNSLESVFSSLVN